ncbi:MAG: CRISPR-associated helicase Cas3' [Rhodobacteraceae bacterium]|nr:CRISPR-associated helicase Cas3' [Paracoccaceae bacterium]
MQDWVARWPGKSAVVPGGPCHPAIWHMLDVAAVAERLIAPFRFPAPQSKALVLLAALHDLGKIGAQFRGMVLDGTPQRGGSHWKVTEALLRHHDMKLAPVLGMRNRHRFALYAATAGHHGRPPSDEQTGWEAMLRHAGADAIADAGKAIETYAALWPEASLADLSRDDAYALSWWLPGLVAAADWIGSNVEWFPPTAPDLPIEAYWAQARALAEAAVAAAGLASPEVSAAPLFSFALRPMQVAAAEVSLRDGPMLALIEDETGAGKTEAALILAQRMMRAGKGRGLYFALPTMATADAMFGRAREVVGRMFSSGPSLTLAHGRAGLSVEFRDLRGGDRANQDEPGCSDWLAESRRRALLADVGIGTIDQALLGVLPTRHACLRLFGLSSKILIVDEVHEMGDPYLEELLAALLRAHAALGGSAILLTATLPMGLRARLVTAFEAGAGRDTAAPADADYPALTVPGGAVRTDLPKTTGARGPVQVERLAAPEVAVDLLVDRARQGAACVWVRNAVDEAMSAVRSLRDRGISANLLHARFALGDRKRHEASALDRFGKGGQGREGRVLVATQVVESSLDLDFDVMVSDLAPMAALIQRAGRLWRHMDLRPQATRSVPAPVLYVVAPDPNAVGDARWLHSALGAGAHVYDLPLQWRTADVVFRTGRIEAPGNLRALIEAAHGEDGDLPEALLGAEVKALGAAHGKRAHGKRNVVDFAAGFRQGAGGWEDTEFPTRLGQEMRALVLTRWQDGELVPWAIGETAADSAQLSEVQASARRLAALDLPDQTAAAIVAFTADWPDWRRRAVMVCPVDEDGVICAGLRYDAEQGLMFTSTTEND